MDQREENGAYGGAQTLPLQFGNTETTKNAKEFEETGKTLEDRRTHQEDQLLDTHLKLVESNILARKFEKATQIHERLVKFVACIDLSPEEVKDKADYCKKSKTFIRAFVLFDTASKLVKLKKGKLIEAEFIKKLTKEMNEIVCELNNDKSKKDIATDYFIPFMRQFTAEEIMKKGTSTYCLNHQQAGQSREVFVCHFLLNWIEETILERKYDKVEKMRFRLVEFLKRQEISTKEVTNMAEQCKKDAQYIKSYILYFSAARLAKLTMSGKRAGEVIYKQVDNIAGVCTKIINQLAGLNDIITDHIVPTTFEFTVTNLMKGRTSEAGYLNEQHKEFTPKLVTMLVDLAASEAKDGKFASAIKAIEIILHVAKLQQLTPEYLDNVGDRFQFTAQYAKAFLWYLSATEMEIMTTDGCEVNNSIQDLLSTTMGLLSAIRDKLQDKNLIVGLIRASMDKIHGELKDRKDMPREELTIAQSWCSLFTAFCFYFQDNKNTKHAIGETESVIKVLKDKLGENAKKYKVWPMAITVLAILHMELHRKDQAVSYLQEAISTAKCVKDWKEEEGQKEFIQALKEKLRNVRGISAIPLKVLAINLLFRNRILSKK